MKRELPTGTRDDSAAIAHALDVVIGRDEWYALHPNDLARYADRIRRRLAGAGWVVIRKELVG